MQTRTGPDYGYTARLPGVSIDDARTRVADALKQEGFGVLTEINVQATLKAKLDRDFRPYVILGACNPELAHRALEVDLGIGLLLPCNVCLWEEGSDSVVSIIRPAAMFQVVSNPAVQPVVDEADQRLRNVIQQIGGAGA